jgi:hypothetical protein
MSRNAVATDQHQVFARRKMQLIRWNANEHNRVTRKASKSAQIRLSFSEQYKRNSPERRQSWDVD